MEASTGGLVRFADLGDGLPRFARQRRWDRVMSLGVAEHLPRSLEPLFVHNLVSPRPRGIVLCCWARVGQTGHHHVNCQSHQYVQCVLDPFGYRTDARRTALLLATLKHAPGRRANCSSLSPNLQVFSRRSAPSSKLGFSKLGFVLTTRERGLLGRVLAPDQGPLPVHLRRQTAL